MAMFDVYSVALGECNYRATYFLQMFQKEGGITTDLCLIQALSHAP
jgi:hypothetical protein